MTTSTPTAQAVQTLATRWSQKSPYQATRISKAVALVASVTVAGPDTYTVEGETGDYTVRVDREHKVSICTCPDHQKTMDRCKHIWACGLYEAAQEK